MALRKKSQACPLRLCRLMCGGGLPRRLNAPKHGLRPSSGLCPTVRADVNDGAQPLDNLTRIRRGTAFAAHQAAEPLKRTLVQAIEMVATSKSERSFSLAKKRG